MSSRRQMLEKCMPAIKVASYVVSTALSVGAILYFVAVYFVPKFGELTSRQSGTSRLLDDVSRERLALKHFEWQNERLATDPEFLEMVARDMGMARTNESFCKLVDGVPDRTNLAQASAQQLKPAETTTSNDAGRKSKSQHRTKR